MFLANDIKKIGTRKYLVDISVCQKQYWYVTVGKYFAADKDTFCEKSLLLVTNWLSNYNFINGPI